MTLPEGWQFLGPWWLALHAIAISLIFYMGYLIGRHSAEDSAHEVREMPPPPPRPPHGDRLDGERPDQVRPDQVH